MNFSFIVPIAVSGAVALAAAFGMRALAKRWGVVDRPDGQRKLHAEPVPLWGGLAILLGLLAGLAVAVGSGLLPGDGTIRIKHLIGLALGATVLAVGGALDDRLNLKPSRQLAFPILATLILIVAGVGIAYVTNPWGGVLHLDQWRFDVIWWEGLPYRLTLLADLFTFAWLMGMTYTTKLLDGVDGLVAGLAVIGCLVVAAVAQLQEVSQPETTLLALIIGAAFAALWLLNRHPARLFLGEGGATMAGFLLGALGIISGGKIATALLILGLPIIDTALVILRRLRAGRPPFVGDREHLHFRLLAAGWSQRQTVLFYYLMALTFGVSTLALRGAQKAIALALLAVVTVAVVQWAVRRAARADKIA